MALLAFNDLSAFARSSKNYLYGHSGDADSAMRWIARPSYTVGGFDWVCCLIDRDPAAMRQRIVASLRDMAQAAGRAKEMDGLCKRAGVFG